MQINTQWDATLYSLEWLKFKRLAMFVKKDLEQLALLDIAGGDVQ